MKAKNSVLTKVLLITLTVTLFSLDLPQDWFKAGNKPDSYFMDIDKDVKRLGKDVYTIKSIDKNPCPTVSMSSWFLQARYNQSHENKESGRCPG